jgi:hypothetical protein
VAPVAGKPIHFKTVLDGFRSVCDWPANYFYKQLMETYPDAKVRNWPGRYRFYLWGNTVTAMTSSGPDIFLLWSCGPAGHAPVLVTRSEGQGKGKAGS